MVVRALGTSVTRRTCKMDTAANLKAASTRDNQKGKHDYLELTNLNMLVVAKSQVQANLIILKLRKLCA